MDNRKCNTSSNLKNFLVLTPLMSHHRKRIHDIYAKFRDPAGPPPATETPAVGSGTFPKIYWS